MRRRPAYHYQGKEIHSLDILFKQNGHVVLRKREDWNTNAQIPATRSRTFFLSFLFRCSVFSGIPGGALLHLLLLRLRLWRRLRLTVWPAVHVFVSRSSLVGLLQTMHYYEAASFFSHTHPCLPPAQDRASCLCRVLNTVTTAHYGRHYSRPTVAKWVFWNGSEWRQ